MTRWKLYSVESPSLIVLVATFELVDGRVIAEYANDNFRKWIAKWTVTVDDGEAFIAEIERKFGRGSRFVLKRE